MRTFSSSIFCGDVPSEWRAFLGDLIGRQLARLHLVVSRCPASRSAISVSEVLHPRYSGCEWVLSRVSFSRSSTGLRPCAAANGTAVILPSVLCLPRILWNSLTWSLVRFLAYALVILLSVSESHECCSSVHCSTFGHSLSPLSYSN